VTDEVYIGSTCQPTVARRLAKHVVNYNEHKKGKCGYTTSFRIIERGDYNIYLIENFPCDNKDELTKREGELIKQMKNDETVVNRNIPGRTNAEYRIDNADKISVRHKQYYQQNADKIKQRYQQNADKILMQRKQYRRQNAEKISEQKKQHYQQNAEKICEQQKQYYQQNADKICEQKKQYDKGESRKIKTTCECGSTYRKRDKVRHECTTKHIKFIESNNDPAN